MIYQSKLVEAVTQPGTITSGEGLAEAIQLLSCRPMRSATQNIPASASGITPWPETHEERIHKRMYAGMPFQRYLA